MQLLVQLLVQLLMLVVNDGDEETFKRLMLEFLKQQRKFRI